MLSPDIGPTGLVRHGPARQICEAMLKQRRPLPRTRTGAVGHGVPHTPAVAPDRGMLSGTLGWISPAT